MKIKTINITIVLIIFFNTNIFSQYVNLSEIKYTLDTKFYDLKLTKIIGFLENYKNDEIEILTLEMEKIGKRSRIIKDGKIYFGTSTFSNELGTRIYNEMGEEDLYFNKIKSPKLNDRFKIYHSLSLFINKEILYNTLIEIGNRDDYKLISKKFINGGVLKVFEFIPKDKRKGFMVQTLDGDKISRITFMLSY
jgi:hypothetical protein